MNRYFFDLSSTKPVEHHEGGSLTRVTSAEVTGFVVISYENLKLNPRGVMLPIWHTNAAKIGYCTAGTLLVSIRTLKSVEQFIVKKGELFFVPMGYAHYIENIGNEPAEVQFAFNHTTPETMRFVQAVHAIADSVFDATFGTHEPFVRGIKKKDSGRLIHTLPSTSQKEYPSANKYKFIIEKSGATVTTNGGYLQDGLVDNLATLDGLGVLGFMLAPKGSVEPHWHTNAGELIYIVSGEARITILSPNGYASIIEATAGYGAFAPASYFHSIENTGTSQMQAIAFFNSENPDYVGIAQVFGSFSNEILASIFSVEPSYFEKMRKTSNPLVIVPQ